MKQSNFSDLEYQPKKKATRKEKFLSELGAILPWKLLLKPIREQYPKAGRWPSANGAGDEVENLLHATVVSAQ